jgi:hypothetical protein
MSINHRAMNVGTVECEPKSPTGVAAGAAIDPGATSFVLSRRFGSNSPRPIVFIPSQRPLSKVIVETCGASSGIARDMSTLLEIHGKDSSGRSGRSLLVAFLLGLWSILLWHQR